MQRTAIQCSLICVKSAVELIETLYNHNISAGTWGQKPTWLYAVLRTMHHSDDETSLTLPPDIYLAATVLLAARLAPNLLLVEISAQRVQTAWDHALAILQGFQANSTSAQKCVAALQLLYHKLPAIASYQGQTEGYTAHTAAGAERPAHHLDQAEPGILEDTYDHTFFTDMNGDFDMAYDTAGWLEGIDFTDPYDMSWFLAPDMAGA